MSVIPFFGVFSRIHNLTHIYSNKYMNVKKLERESQIVSGFFFSKIQKSFN